MKHHYYSHGKLLLTSEYLVLDGAQALALPTKKGQHLDIKAIDQEAIIWRSYLSNGELWLDYKFSFPLDSNDGREDAIYERLLSILQAAEKLNSSFLSTQQGYEVESTLEFQKDWGLGSSSTLLANIARWASVDPYKLLDMTFGGSGYDIACATTESALIYQKTSTTPIVTPVTYNPPFKDELYFVYLNKKQNSRESIKHYRSLDQAALTEEKARFSKFTQDLLGCKSILAFEKLLSEHEDNLSRILKTPTIKTQLFADYPRAIKSLGGWGGDFVLVVGTTSQMDYFRNKGYDTIVPYKEMILGE
ncbi:GYDIA family GHMP kinase [uncultured Dokdonia sp.]|uniref:GYDIA family GHMP kinase n=1 Tax=uncultured Dokdonia sp. TaxID=575653 RepID=UPI002613E246|nr:GYDIA family GHMP kinase [uncultured Dokdonia sp.]